LIRQQADQTERKTYLNNQNHTIIIAIFQSKEEKVSTTAGQQDRFFPFLELNRLL